jgi:flavin reductase (DIM6/NTAB) family NADH-FMN oxidoreductase RutF
MQEVSETALAVGKIPSGLFIVTASQGEAKEGYLGSWIQQASFSPLMLNLAIRPGRPCYDLIRSTGRVGINIVGHKNGGMMKPFWSPEAGADPFSGLEWSRSERGNIRLASALAFLECELRSTFTPGDHEIFFVEVMDGLVLQAEDKPLGHVRKSGLGY